MKYKLLMFLFAFILVIQMGSAYNWINGSWSVVGTTSDESGFSDDDNAFDFNNNTYATKSWTNIAGQSYTIGKNFSSQDIRAVYTKVYGFNNDPAGASLTIESYNGSTWNNLLSQGFTNGDITSVISYVNVNNSQGLRVTVNSGSNSGNADGEIRVYELEYLVQGSQLISPSNNSITSSSPFFNASIYTNSTYTARNSSLYIFNQSYYDLIHDSNLVAYYKLDGNANDETGRNNGTLVNSPTSTEGKVGGAYVYDGSTSWINTTNIFNSEFNNGFTSSVWVKWYAQGDVNNGRVYDMNTQSDYMEILDTNGRVDCAFNNLSASYMVGTGTDVSDHNWHLLNCVYNGSYVSVYQDGTLRKFTASTGIIGQANRVLTLSGKYSSRFYNGTIDEVMIFNRSLSANEIYTLYNQSQARYVEDLNSTGTKSFQTTLSNFQNGVKYYWNVWTGAYNSTGSYFGALSSLFEFTGDTVAPTISVVFPANNTVIYSLNSSTSRFVLNGTAIDTNTISTVWYNSSFNSTPTFITNGANTTINLNNVFGSQILYVYANDTVDNIGYSSVNVLIHRSYFDNRTGFETENQTLSLELWNQTSTPTSGILNYNGTNYTATITSVGNSKYTLNRTLDIPTSTGLKNFKWFWSSSSSDTYSQVVNGTYFVYCNTTITTPYLNVSFKNETTAMERVTASIASSSFDYYLGSGTVTKSYTYSSATERANFTFCAVPSTIPLNINESINYANSYSAQRTYTNDTAINASPTQQILYLLPNSLGLYVTFQVINPALQPISGVEVAISSSTFGSVETKTTDDSGAVTFFLNPLVAYSLVATKSGLPTYSTTITPTQTEYTITMGLGSTNTTVEDYFRGVTYSILPGNNYLANSTTYNFNFTINSQYWDLEEYGFYLSNGTTNFGSTSDTGSTGGIVNLDLNTGDNNTIILNAYWVIQGNYTNVSKTYIIYDSSGSDTSLANLRDRIRIYIDAGGFFGLTAFGLNILVFLTIFITTGLLSYKFGFTSPFAVLAVMLGFTMLFDYLNFITYASTLPEDAASILLGILVLGFGIKEAMQ